MAQTCRCLNCITPPHILKRLMESRNEDVRKAALATLLGTERLRGQRSLRATLGLGIAGAPSNGRRSIFDCGHSVRLMDAKLVRTEQGPASPDPSVTQAFNGLGATRDFYQKVFKRNSIDGKGMNSTDTSIAGCAITTPSGTGRRWCSVTATGSSSPISPDPWT